MVPAASERRLGDRLQGQLCGGILLCRGLSKPRQCDLLIDRFSVALPIAQAKVVLGSGVALICRCSFQGGVEPFGTLVTDFAAGNLSTTS